MNENTNNTEHTPNPVETSNEPIRLVDSTLLMALDEILSPQVSATVELPDGTKIPLEEYDEPLHRDGEISLVAEDDGDLARPRTRAALEQIAAAGTIRPDEIAAVLDQLVEMGGRSDSSVVRNVCKTDWGSAS